MGAEFTGAERLPRHDGARRDSLDRLVPLVYQELRSIAHRHRASRGRGGSLTTGALVHEAYLKLARSDGDAWSDHSHFLAVASIAMRQLLVNRARARAAQKRSGAVPHVTLADEDGAADSPEMLLALDEALRDLARFDARLARVVECRFFGGLSEEEIATALGVTVRTVQRDWVKARALLRRTLDASP